MAGTRWPNLELYFGRMLTRGLLLVSAKRTETRSWQTLKRCFKKLLQREVQIDVEQFVHRDECSTAKVSLHRGKFEFVEAFWIR